MRLLFFRYVCVIFLPYLLVYLFAFLPLSMISCFIYCSIGVFVIIRNSHNANCVCRRQRAVANFLYAYWHRSQQFVLAI